MCGNLGAALAAGITAALAFALGWRAAFLVPALLCMLTGIVYLRLVPDDRHRTAKRIAAPEAVLSPRLTIVLFLLFTVVALGAGRNVEKLADQISLHRPSLVSVQNEEVAEKLKLLLRERSIPAPRITVGDSTAYFSGNLGQLGAFGALAQTGGAAPQK